MPIKTYPKLTALVLFLFLGSVDRKPVEPVHTVETIFYKVSNEVFSEELLIEAIKQMKLDHPHIVLAQAKLETGHFKSTIFLENNNLFGMKQARSRPTTALGEHRGHAVYRNWRESLIDYVLYSAYYTDDKSEHELYVHLGEHYAEDPIYEVKLRDVVEREELEILF
jgi:flagellum-specific peptidoglycan hydrolase FlgJ